MKKTIKTALLIIGIISCIILTSCISKPPELEITYGEFPFKLVYEIDGEQFVIEDTYVIEYKGRKYDFELGEGNIWNYTYKGLLDGEKIYEYKERVLVIQNNPTIEFMLGSPEYYFGLEEENILYTIHRLKPGDIRLSSYKYDGPITEEELYEKYGIKIIEKYISPPLFERDDSKE